MLNLSYLIKKNKKGNYIHFKIEGSGKTIVELEKNEKIDKNLLRYLTVKVKKIDLKTNYFEKKPEETKPKTNWIIKNFKNKKKKFTQNNFAKLSVFQPQNIIKKVPIIRKRTP